MNREAGESDLCKDQRQERTLRLASTLSSLWLETGGGKEAGESGTDVIGTGVIS